MGAKDVHKKDLVKCRYMFDVTAEVMSRSVGESPRGELVDIQYESGKVTTVADEFLLDWWDTLSSTQQDDVVSLWNDCGIKVSADGSGRRQRTSIWEAVNQFRNLEPTNEKDRAYEVLKKLRDGQVTPLPWFGFEGKVIAGSDWATFRPDDVAEFSGRMTFQSSDRPDEAIIDTVFSGVVDLCPVNPHQGLSDARRDAMRSRNGQTPVNILLSVTFDVGKAAQKWAPKRYVRQGTGYWKYQRLTQGQFVAVGTADLAKEIGQVRVSRVELSVLEIKPASAYGGPSS
jgi:hypothetical protein